VSAALLICGVVGMMLVRAPHIRRSMRMRVASSRETRIDRALVALVSLGLVLPVAWLTGALSFAEAAASPLRLAAGACALALGLFVLQRSHADLGENWSNTLELREGHALVTGGVYARVRHPMYVALLLHGLGQTLVVPNWIAGPAFLVPFAVLVAVRLRAEEQMMKEAFGAAYDAYARGTARLVPFVW
jgi:protein-S-isoprenylcysteine O-methyltransferase Ste14